MTAVLEHTDTLIGAPYIVGDPVWVQAPASSIVPWYACEVQARAYSPGPFGLCWVLTVRHVGTTDVRIVRVDDNGRNVTRGHGVLPRFDGE